MNLDIEPYSLSKTDKHRLLTQELSALTQLHYRQSEPYHRMLDALNFDVNNITDYYDIPFLPVRLFKEMDLLSVPENQIVKTMTSSGTTGRQVSKIYLDRDTASNQTKVLSKIVSDFIGKKRMPMLIIDSASVIKDRQMFSARGAGILGFSIFSSKRMYVLDENMQIDMPSIQSFLEEHSGAPIFLFGFTFMIWQHFYKELVRTGFRPDLSSGILIHGGGWKKLMSESVSKEEFKQRLTDVCGIRQVHDYYGMVEQTGAICMECEQGHLHTSVFSDVIIRNTTDFSAIHIGERGIIQVLSVLPRSYPGHSLLTEDEGVLLGEDDCPCGRAGKYFKIEGRIKNSELRGCSDTYAVRF
jgi:phenylacetate-coenzyme A ligase PaaK-like adenylate-forming protein